jgi:glycosyltransferase involved in cell wall biosynthesis
MRVVWAGTFEPSFSRNRRLDRLLTLAGVEVQIVREPLWPSDRVALAGGSWWRAGLSALWRYPRLLCRLLVVPRPDLYLVSYPGWFDLPVVRFASVLKGRPIVFDPFISLHDTMVSDRRLSSEGSWRARVTRTIDRWSLRLATVVVADTASHLELYERMAPGLLDRGQVLPLGADDEIFRPRPEVDVDPRLVMFHGTFVPLQGVGTIVEAAARLGEDDARVSIIGDGQTRTSVERAVRETGAQIDMPGLLPIDELPNRLAGAAVCLGIFGASEKAARVVPHKLFECLAIGRPVITRESPAIASLFEEGELVTVPPSDPEALANAIRALIADPARREQIAAQGHLAYLDRFHELPLSRQLARILESAIG